jgi:trans-aconitate methyltransferase
MTAIWHLQFVLPIINQSLTITYSMSTTRTANESWDDTAGYELYVGRWSRQLSADFIQWLRPKPGSTWLEIGCGTGALTSAILHGAKPAHVVAIDKSAAYLQQAQKELASANVTFVTGDVESVAPTKRFDMISSGLVLNFLPHPAQSLRRLMHNLNPGGQLSSFVWDYAGHYQPMRYFWDAAGQIFETAAQYDAGIKFQICNPERLTSLFKSLGLTEIEVTNIERIATFDGFDDYWEPIAAAQGSVTEFMNTLSSGQKADLKETVRKRLPIAANGEIKLVLNALAIKGSLTHAGAT